ncbi:alpha/beta hydrolase [Allosphingosinicella deserti]|uniref:Esterase n=1 Tax=Allosphingosinicella deserti TaxID=2116704 RepID=A0A2P7QLT9_9SPHN|nr:alpha/beta hydrolase [Sphingomonas deserti]PSJ38936.1 esterase [Sphingomonas deserti]
MSLDITAADEEAARRVNRMLARAPRFKIRNRFDPLLYQSLLRVSQVGADWRIRRKGIVPSTLRVGSGTRPVSLRLLQPAKPVRGVVLDIHGGGWAIGNAILDDRLNAGLIAACDVAVVSVDYRLATKAPLRGLLDDCFEAAVWLLGESELFAGLPIILVGESAGAHLAAATLQRLRASGRSLDRIAGALLYYGVYDLAGTASVRNAGRDTLILDGPGMLDAMRMLTPAMHDSERRHPSLSPLYGELAGMPPALLFVGDRDPLLDDTVAMAQRWGDAAPAEVHVVPESPHGFIRLPTPIATKALRRAHGWIDERLEAWSVSPASRSTHHKDGRAPVPWSRPSASR